MRDYGKVSPFFWTRGSGKRLRGDLEGQVIALYLVTCPAANMIGVYYLPLVSVAHETGIPLDRVEGTMARLAKADFAHYDHDAELVWVPNMAAYQIGDTLDASDKRRRGPLVAELAKVGHHRFADEFRSRYSGAYHLTFARSQIERECIPFQSADERMHSASIDQEQDQKQEQEQERESERDVPATPSPDPAVESKAEKRKTKSKGTRLPEDWRPAPETIEWCHSVGVDPEPLIPEFVDYWTGVAGQKGVKLSWDGTFRNRVRDLRAWGKAPPWTANKAPEPVQAPQEYEPISDAAKAALEAAMGIHGLETQASLFAVNTNDKREAS